MPPLRQVELPQVDPQEQPEALEEESSDSSTGSAATTELFEDEGPDFEPGEQPDQERVAYTRRPGDEPELLAGDGWDPNVVASNLETIGLVIHTTAGVGESDWLFTQKELRTIAPPLARILNRYDATRLAAAAGDDLAVLAGLAAYTLRSVKERKEVLEGTTAEDLLAAHEVGIPNAPPAPEA